MGSSNQHQQGEHVFVMSRLQQRNDKHYECICTFCLGSLIARNRAVVNFCGHAHTYHSLLSHPKRWCVIRVASTNRMIEETRHISCLRGHLGRTVLDDNVILEYSFSISLLLSMVRCLMVYSVLKQETTYMHFAHVYIQHH